MRLLCGGYELLCTVDMLTFFYDDFGYAPDLTPLGRIESGLEYLQEIDGGSTVTIELVE